MKEPTTGSRGRGQRRHLKKLLRFIPAAGWAVLLFVLSAQANLPGPPHFPHADKIVHAGFYAVLTWLLLFGDNWPSGTRAFTWALLAIVYGLTDELHQALVPRRQPDVLDFLADALGALGAATATLLFTRARSLRSKHRSSQRDRPRPNAAS